MNARTPMLDGRTVTPWRLGRVEIRPKISPREEVVARVELIHAERGRVTEIAAGEGGVEAGFAAIARIVGVTAALERLSVSAVPTHVADGIGCEASACVTVRRGGFSASGGAVASDMLSACFSAFMQALLRAQKMTVLIENPPSA